MSEQVQSFIISQEDFILFSLLRPNLYKDGDQWCCLYGENLQEGIAGFGSTPHLAVKNWRKEWDKSLNSKPQNESIINEEEHIINRWWGCRDLDGVYHAFNRQPYKLQGLERWVSEGSTSMILSHEEVVGLIGRELSWERGEVAKVSVSSIIELVKERNQTEV